MAEKILIADDDELLRELLHDILEQEGYEVIEAEEGIKALELYKRTPNIDLAILDILMPGRDGIAVLKEIQGTSDIPVILLTALGNPENELEGFENGACDYVTKPFHKEVLLARVQAALRFKRNKPKEAVHIQRMGELEVDLDSCTVYVKKEKVELTNKEYQLLIYLMENRNIVLTRDQILERIWGFDYEGDIRTIDTHIKMLRMDLRSCGNYIRTVRGMGYLFREEG